MNITRRIAVVLLATAALAGTGHAAQARPVPDEDRGVCRSGYHLVGATCFPNGNVLIRIDRRSFGGTF